MKKLYAPILGITAFVGLISIISYNTIQIRDIEVHRSWSDLEATLQRRADLVPNLVETVRAYASHEQDTFLQVIKARQIIANFNINNNSQESELKEYQQAQDQLSQSLKKMFAVYENYPELKANENFRDLQHQLEGTENRINIARQQYNQEVANFNRVIKTLPHNLINSLFLHYSPKVGFQTSYYANTVPTVNFNK